MKILLASSSFKGGGISSYAHEVINNYFKGNDFYIIVGNDANMPITNSSVKVFHYECEDISFLNLKSILKFINDEIKPDLILSNNASAITLLAPYFNDDIRIITLSHSLKYIEADKSAFNQKYIDKIIAASSQYNKAYLHKKFRIKDIQKIDVLYNFVEEYPNASLLREQKKRGKEEIMLLFPGGGHPSKSPDIVLNVLRKLLKTNLSFKFYWTGSTYIFLSRFFPFFRLKDIKDLLPKDKRLIFTGRLPKRQDIINLYAKSNIFFTPSRREGCPISLIEAMRVGTISIVADYQNGNKEIIRNCYNGFVINHKCIDEFVKTITNIINNHEDYIYIYDNSYKTYKEILSYPVWKSKMDNIVYNPVLNHVKRYSSLKKTKLCVSIIKFRILRLVCDIQRIFEESLIVYLKLLSHRFRR